MCQTNFPASKRNPNPLNILVHLQLQCVLRGKKLGFSWRMQNSGNQKLTYDFTTHIDAQFGFICHPLIVNSTRKLDASCGKELGGQELQQLKANPGLPNTSQYTVLLYLTQLGRNSNVKLCSSFHRFGVRVNEGEKS